MRSRTKKISLVAAAIAVLVAAAGAVHAVGADQSTLVSQVPSKATPNIIDGNIYAIVQVGSRIIVGGSFTKANPPGDTNSAHSVAHRGILAFDATTGQIDTTFAPVLPSGSGVRALIPGPSADTVYVGGTFTTINGVARRNLALLSTVTGQPVTTFVPPVLNDTVWTIQHVGSHLIVGGEFTSAGGTTHNGLAAVNATTGAIDNAFLGVNFTGHHNYNGVSGANGAVGVHAVDVSPDGTRLVVVGNFKNAGGAIHDQIAMLDLTAASAVLDPHWNTSGYTAACSSTSYDTYVRGVSFAPDGSYFVVVTTGGGGTTTKNTDGTRSMCDTASRWNIADTGTNVRPVWIDYSGNDSFESVTVTTTAIYAGGHFRWNNNAKCTDCAGAGAVPRPGIAALDPLNGMPFAWNPGRNPRGAGAYALYTTPNGLYVGGDTDDIGTGSTFTERDRISYFPLTGGEVIPDYVPQALPADIYLAGKTSGTSPDIVAQIPFSGSSAGTATTLATSGIAWSKVRGAFTTGTKLFYGMSDGNFYTASFDGTTVGAPSLIDPYDDPTWSNVQTGSGQTFRGVKSDLYGTEMTNVQGMVYSSGRIYYSVAGQSTLRYRYFEPDDGVIGSEEFTAAATVAFGNVAGMFLTGSTLFYADAATGNLHSVGWNNGAPSAGTDSIVSGPAIDGKDWRARGMFAKSALISLPTATFTRSCADLTCTFDAGDSTAPDSSVASYSWDFGDGTQGSGVTPSHVFGGTGSYSVTLTVTSALGGHAQRIQSLFVAAPTPPSAFVPVGPTRIMDTRAGTGGVPKAKVGAGGTVTLQVAGVATIPATGVTAVVLNVSALNPTAATYVQVYPHGQSVPSASNLQLAKGQSLDDLVTVQVVDGKVNFRNSAGTVDLLADVSGYYTSTGSGAYFTSVTPTRILDTRTSTPVGKAPVVKLPVTGRGGIPATGVTAVVLNLAVLNSSATSWVTAYADGQAKPGTAAINFAKGQNVDNLVIVPVVNGYVDLAVGSGTVDLLADVAGYFGSTGAAFHPSPPIRIMDTRTGNGVPKAVIGAAGVDTVDVAGAWGVPATGVTAVVLNVTVTGATATSWMTVFPNGVPLQSTANLNYVAGSTIANLVVVPVVNGKVDFRNQAGTVNAFADLAGYFTG